MSQYGTDTGDSIDDDRFDRPEPHTIATSTDASARRPRRKETMDATSSIVGGSGSARVALLRRTLSSAVGARCAIGAHRHAHLSTFQARSFTLHTARIPPRLEAVVDDSGEERRE
jgi:hypothetical protein